MKENELTPKQIVAELNKYIVGQNEAKKSVAIALRNRWRRKKLNEEMQDEIIPKNILLIGPTGVGKTEIARRLAKLVGAPFIKVEATKYTEVGYVGRDVEQIIRDLVANAIRMVQEQEALQYEAKAEEEANKRILQVFWPKKTAVTGSSAPSMAVGVEPMQWIACVVQSSETAVGSAARAMTLIHRYQVGMACRAVRKSSRTT